VNRDNIDKLVDHLFRHEAGKMVSVLTRTFGTDNLEVAEDVVQDALLQAAQVWPVRGIPDNPSAWLYRAAKNRAIDVLRRNDRSVRFSDPDESSVPDPSAPLQEAIEKAWDVDLIKDDMLRMMFACCHPGIPEESQVTLILKTLCGFSASEIARAFLTSEDTISKRLYRAKEFFRQNRIEFTVPPSDELRTRSEAVLNSIYLLFNEGYNSTDSDILVRADLMEEAMLLCKLLSENAHTEQPATFALMALMCFHASRNDTRLSPAGEIVLLANQDRTKWNFELISLGNKYMEKAAFGDSVSKYHIEAAIAFEHCAAESYERTDWKRILELYDWLCAISPSPVWELNRAVAVLQVRGPDSALKAVLEIQDKKKIGSYYLYHSLLGEIYSQLNRLDEAKAEFETARKTTKSETERKLLASKLNWKDIGHG
jgi:RNA polymerase sigma factor (sigma-70 family)